MSADASGPARARPLSGGLWTLLAWLRRDAGSSDSLSSDGTVASFAFLPADRCRLRPAPLYRPPDGPPTDSYKKRVRDRNLRLQYDRDLTLHRKYGLFRGENSGYDAFSLPSVRKIASDKRDRQDRERRAASECLQRRAPHVPGKRRAPPPPRAAILAAPRPASLTAPRRARKRPAPQPPRPARPETNRVATITEEQILTQMNKQSSQGDPSMPRNDATECKPEKYVKKEVKDPKLRTEKSFLKQIFENRKRNSAVETIPERILPSISELDKQAAEIIESCKLKVVSDGIKGSRGHQPRSRGDMWFCTRCLRKYDDSVVTCVHCVTEQKLNLGKKLTSDNKTASSASSHCTQTENVCVASTSRVTEVEEKQKLKDMLKEIKDSLPKKIKPDGKSTVNIIDASATTSPQKTTVIDAPTLRIGSKICDEVMKSSNTANPKVIDLKTKSTNDVKPENSKPTLVMESAVMTQPVVLQHLPSRDIIKLEDFKASDLNQKTKINLNKSSEKEFNVIDQKKNRNKLTVPIGMNKFRPEPPTTSYNNLNTPLKISSLLNYNSSPEKNITRNNFFSQSGNEHNLQPGNGSPNKSPNDNNKPSPLIIQETGLNSQTSLNTAATVGSLKSVYKDNSLSQEQAMRKTHKVTTTTQTTSGVQAVSPLTSKQIANKIKHVPNNLVIADKINKTEADTPKKLLLPSHSFAPADSTPASTSNGSPQSTIKIENEDGLKFKHSIEYKDNYQSQKQNESISTGTPESSVPRALNNNQYKPANTTSSFDLHSRRRNLVNQLEQSIAKGDEQAAAEAAAKLAQLRLSCSVLSFSSQIVGAASSSSSNVLTEQKESVSQCTEMDPTVATPIKPITHTVNADNLDNSTERKLIPVQSRSGDFINQKLEAKNNNPKIMTTPSVSKLYKGLKKENEMVSIEVWIEDKEAARGPIRMSIPRLSVMGDLRRHAHAHLGLAAHLQRWIVGRTLCTDDNMPLNTLAGPGFDAPFYLCLVEPETSKYTASRSGGTAASTSKKETTNGINSTDVYSELVLLERRALVPNAEEFECGVCMEHYAAGQGAVLRECVHTFCKECLSDVIKHCEEPAVSCPAMGCPGVMQEREIRALVVPEEYERWLALGLAAAESGTRNAFHCRTRDCTGWALCEPGVTKFPCPVCKRTNCVACQAIHEGDSCEQFLSKQRAAEASDEASAQTDEGTRAFLDTLISRGEALECPECSAIIIKKWGCDWIKCSACKTEICWVTRGRRWGPGGRGDTSAGCRCGVDGMRCHPSCGYCH